MEYYSNFIKYCSIHAWISPNFNLLLDAGGLVTYVNYSDFTKRAANIYSMLIEHKSNFGFFIKPAAGRIPASLHVGHPWRAEKQGCFYFWKKILMQLYESGEVD